MDGRRKEKESSNTQSKDSQTEQTNSENKDRDLNDLRVVDDGTKMKRYRPNAVSLMEIRQYQRATELVIDRRSFQQLVKEVLRDMSRLDCRFQVKALEALQEASESYLIEMFTDINLRKTNEQRARITPKDLELVRKIRGDPQ